MGYTIGLDIGITSVGWSVIEDDSNGNPIRIIDLGSRIFDAAEKPKDGSPLAKERRDARGLRRRLRRKATPKVKTNGWKKRLWSMPSSTFSNLLPKNLLTIDKSAVWLE